METETEDINKKRRGYFVPLEEIPSKYEPKELDFDLGKQSITASLLKVKDDSELDFDIEVMARVVDNFIRDDISNESMKSSEVAFMDKFDKLMQRLGLSVQDEIRKGNSLKVLQRLFSEVAVNNKKSSKSFIKTMRDEVKKARINDLKNKLKQLI